MPRAEGAQEKARPARRRIAYRALLIVGGVLVGLFVAEGALRRAAPRLAPLRDIEITYPMVYPARTTGAWFGFRPGARFEGIYDGDPYGTLPEGNRVVYELNEHGFRDTPFGARIEAPGAISVAILGDSFVFGEGVVAEDRLSNVCQARLADRGRGSARVFNLGMSGYSTYDEIRVARALLPRLEPDWAVLAYCLNDPLDLEDERYADRRGFDFIVRRDKKLKGRPSEHPLHLVRLLENASRDRRISRDTVDWYHDLYRGPRAPWLSSRAGFLEIRDVAAAAGARMAVVILPLFHRVDDGYPFEQEHRLVAEWCETNRIPVLDTQPLFATTPTERLIVHPKDRHPNARAHAIIGEALADFLLAADE